jgi:hypothetical protein
MHFSKWEAVVAFRPRRGMRVFSQLIEIVHYLVLNSASEKKYAAQGEE